MKHGLLLPLRPTMVLLMAFVLLLVTESYSQDSHYWNNHYGTKGVLLGGAVIGSVEDLSATFYNPGYLGIRPAPGVSIGTGVFDFSSLSLNNDTLFIEPLSNVNVQPAPGIVAGQLPIAKDNRNHLAFSIIGRQSINSILSQQYPYTAENGDGYFADLHTANRLSEYWGGVTWARELSENVGFGATLYGAHRSQRRRSDANIDRESESGNVQSGGSTEFLSFWHIRAILKAGVYLDQDSWTAGLTITTAGLPIYGSGEAFIRSSESGAEDPSDNFLTVLTSERSQMTYRSPWSVGAGVGTLIGDFRIHASVEWFSHVAAYESMNPLVSVAGDSNLSIEVIDELSSVVNGGIGLEYIANENASYYLSFVTDNSASADIQQTLSHSKWNIYHVSGGSVFRLDDVVLTGGLGFAFGAVDAKPFHILGGRGGNTIDETTMEVSWFRLRALLGFTYEL